MPRKRHNPMEMVSKLRQVEALRILIQVRSWLHPGYSFVAARPSTLVHAGSRLFKMRLNAVSWPLVNPRGRS